MKSSLFIRLMTGILLFGLAMVAIPAATAEAPAGVTGPATDAVEDASLPLHRIVFYRNGVAYFERRGWVEGRAEVRLTFPADQVPDVLRSLLVLDLGQGRIGSVRHETAAEPAVGAGDLPVTLPAISRQEDLQGGLAGVLKQLQGATVAVARGQETVSGSVLNVEQRQRESADGKWITHHVVLMGADGTVRSVDLAEVKALKILDATARQNLELFSRVTVAAGHKTGQEPQTVIITSEGTRRRELVVSYIAGAPTWTNTYRLVLNEGQPPFLQGWAEIRNYTDEDWPGVRISLVSGKPWNNVKPPGRAKASTRALNGRIPNYQLDGVDNNMTEIIGGTIHSTASDSRSSAITELIAAGDAGVETQTVYGRIEDFFEYQIDYPVRIDARQTALLPIFQGSLPGENISVFRQFGRPAIASGLRIHNTSAVALEPGTMAIYAGGTFIGETGFPELRPNAKKIIPFSDEAALEVSTAEPVTVNEPAYLTRAREGEFKVYYNALRTEKYTIRNLRQDKRVVYVRYDSPGEEWALTDDTPKPVDQENDTYLFRMEMEPGGEKILSIRVKAAMKDLYDLGELSADDIAFFVKEGYIDDSTRESLTQLVSLRKNSEEITARISKSNAERGLVEAERKALLAGIKEIAEAPDARPIIERYVAKLGRLEDRLEQIEADVKKWQAERAALEADHDARMQKIAVEKQLRPMDKELQRIIELD